MTPWGDLWFAEDDVTDGGEPGNRIMGVTPEGDVYPFARTGLSELAGPTFAPDGRTLFVNLWGAGLTLAVWGPFATRSAARQLRLALATPPTGLAPVLSGKLRETAERLRISPYEAAAFERLGAPLA